MRTLSFLALLTLAVSSTFAADPAAASAVPATELPAANHLVYLNELPETADLMKNAAANGLTVARLDRTNDRVVITYSYPDGATATMGYALLSSASTADRLAPKARTVTVVSTEPEILYYEPGYRRTRYVYRDPLDDFWLPLTLGLGIGWVTNHHGHHSGHHTVYRSHGHGGRRR